MIANSKECMSAHFNLYLKKWEIQADVTEAIGNRYIPGEFHCITWTQSRMALIAFTRLTTNECLRRVLDTQIKIPIFNND